MAATMPNTIGRLRLEAIFHPKFENENSQQQDIRQKMKARVAESLGYLEVSIKHSGSLLLWSGGQRFYSKNASENKFTHTGEILLRQHFARAFWKESAEATDDENNPEAVYKECSNYVEAQRLTLSFEVVTSFLGDHGDRPKRDFLILTAIADRNKQGFYSTVNLVALAQRFRLPHNDSWVFSSDKSVDALFAFYDTSRETGFAQSTVRDLSAAAETHVCSMYPHADFQGDIMEGVVIRYVPCQDINEALEKIKRLSKVSIELLDQVPVSRPGSFDLASKASARWPPVLSANLRSLVNASAQSSEPMDQKKFEDDVKDVLDLTESRRSIGEATKVVDVPARTKALLESKDAETRQIAQLIQALSSISDKIDYSVLHEKLADGNSRWLCIIHVRDDKTFQKFQKSTKSGDLPLFRGFSFEICPDNGPILQQAESMNEDTEPGGSHLDERQEAAESLMLKMKFLPYMVRTFGCRNGLQILNRNGPEAFVTYTYGLMNSWQVSIEAKQQWRPFFRAWAQYAHDCLKGTPSFPESKELPALSGFDYLGHMELFTRLYKESKIVVEEEASTDCPFQGLVLVVSIAQEISERVADFIAEQLGGARRLKDFAALNGEAMGMTLEKGRGAVCSATVEDGYGTFRKLLKEYSKYMTIVMFQCSAEDVGDALLLPNANMLKGKIANWKRTRCTIYDLPGSSLYQKDEMETNKEEPFQPSSEFSRTIEQLKVRGVLDDRPGMLVFFPGIPGCGKSSLLASNALDEIRTTLEGTEWPRTLVVQVGDQTKTKFWPLVKQLRLQDRSSVLIADKNAPLQTWENVAKISATSKALVVPVVPDDSALKTTRIVGLRAADGSYRESGAHFYPFSLQYLAVCMSRVLGREAGSHEGKLDSATANACMIVAMFFGLYRKLEGDEFVNTLRARCESAGAAMSDPIKVPFFGDRGKEPLPQDLQDVLTEAIQAQFAIDVIKSSKLSTEYLADLEGRLRASIKRNSGMLEELTADVSFSRKRFIGRMEERLAMLESMSTLDAGTAVTFAKIASIDIDPNAVQTLLRDLAGDARLTACLSLLSVSSAGDMDEEVISSKFVSQTHITMCHCREVSQAKMRATFGPLVGASVPVTVTGILWSATIAALAVSLPAVTASGETLPPGSNKFCHVTIWCETGTMPVEANNLLDMVAAGQAQRVDFEPKVLDGVVSLWEGDK